MGIAELAGPYGVVSLAATLTVSVLIVVALRRGLDVLLKPSMLVALLFHVVVQWPATFRLDEVVGHVPRPWEVVALVHGFALVLTCLSLLVARGQAKVAWDRLVAEGAHVPAIRRREILFVALLLAAATAVYLAYVPWRATGLYAILVDPSQSKVAREASLKLIENPLVAYLHFFAAKVLAPVLACMVVLRPLPERRRLRSLLVRGALLVFAVGAATMSGARLFPVLVALAAGGAFLLRAPQRIRLGLVLPLGLLVLFLLAAQSRLREGQPLTVEALFTYAFVNVLSRRILGVTFSHAVFTADLAQRHGFLGPLGWPRLAGFYDVESTNLANLVYRINYPDSPLTSGLANTSMVFIYYAYIGLAAIALAALFALSLDLVLPLANRLSPAYAVVVLVITGVNSLSLIGSEFTTALVTHGLATGALFVLGLAFLFRRIRAAPPPAAGEPPG